MPSNNTPKIALYGRNIHPYYAEYLKQYFPVLDLCYVGPDAIMIEGSMCSQIAFLQKLRDTDSWMETNQHITAPLACYLLSSPLSSAYSRVSIEKDSSSKKDFIGAFFSWLFATCLVPLLGRRDRLRRTAVLNQSVLPAEYTHPEITSYVIFSWQNNVIADRVHHTPLFIWDSFVTPYWKRLSRPRAASTSSKFACALLAPPFTSSDMDNVHTKTVHFYKELREFGVVDAFGPRSVAENPLPLATNERYLALYAQYRFVLCVEEGFLPKFISTQLPLALAAGAIPLYYGTPDVGEYFNEKAFINLANSTWKQELRLLLNDEEAYNIKRQQPVFTEQNKAAIVHEQESLNKFLKQFAKDLENNLINRQKKSN